MIIKRIFGHPQMRDDDAPLLFTFTGSTRYVPLVAAAGLFAGTIVLSLAGPIDWRMDNAVEVYGFLLAYFTALVVGYLWAVRGRPGAASVTRRWRAPQASALVIVGSAVYLLLYPLTVYDSTGSWFPNVIEGLTNPGQAYDDKTAAALQIPQLAVYLGTLVSPLTIAVMPLTLFFWPRLSRGARLMGIVVLALTLALGVSRAVNQDVGEVCGYLVLFLVLVASTKRDGMVGRWKRVLVCSVGAALVCGLFISYYHVVISGRVQADTVTSSEVAGSAQISPTSPSGATEPARGAITAALARDGSGVPRFTNTASEGISYALPSNRAQVGGPAPDPNNLVRDPDIDGIGSWGVKGAWSIATGLGTPATGDSNGKALRYTANNRYAQIAEPLFRVTPDETFTMSYQCRRTGTSPDAGSVAPQVFFYDNSGAFINAGGSPDQSAVSMPLTWTPASATVTAPAGAVTAQIVARATAGINTGFFDFDQISLVRTENAGTSQSMEQTALVSTGVRRGDSVFYSVVPAAAQPTGVMFTSYLTQGYKGLSLAMDSPWRPTYGLGFSTFIRHNLTRVLGLDEASIEARTYEGQVDAKGWTAGQQWSSFFVHPASDLSFYGVIPLMLLIGFGFGAAWRDTCVRKDPFACVVFFYLGIELLYLSANNQLYQGGELAVGFTVALIAWLLFRTGRRPAEPVGRHVWGRPSDGGDGPGSRPAPEADPGDDPPDKPFDVDPPNYSRPRE